MKEFVTKEVDVRLKKSWGGILRHDSGYNSFKEDMVMNRND